MPSPSPVRNRTSDLLPVSHDVKPSSYPSEDDHLPPENDATASTTALAPVSGSPQSEKFASLPVSDHPKPTDPMSMSTPSGSEESLALRLSDDQLSEVMRLCRPLAPRCRDALLRILAHELRGRRDVGDGELHRIARTIIKDNRLFDPPLESQHGGKYAR
jgi:hypothetical protein